MKNRVKHIINDLETLRENLLALSDDIWLNINHNDSQALDEGYQFKKAYNEKLVEFENLAVHISVMINQFLDIGIETSQKVEKTIEDNERIVQSLDKEVPHSLDEDYCYKRPYGFILQETAFKDITTWRGLYVAFCKELASKDSIIFTMIPEKNQFKGRRNKYFSTNQQELRFAIQITDSIYAEGNLSANGIIDMIKKLLTEFDIEHNNMKIFLREDRNAD